VATSVFAGTTVLIVLTILDVPLPVAAMYPCVEDVWLRDYLGRDAVETHRRIERQKV
jgi:hypothetical protein